MMPIIHRSLANAASSVCRTARPSWLSASIVTLSPITTPSGQNCVNLVPRSNFSLLSSSLSNDNATNTNNSTVTSQQTRHRSSRSLRGLYDGKDVRFGNNVPFSMKKTRRRWNPNVVIKKIYSETLNEMIPFHVTTSALRTIDKMGGLDNYLLTSKNVHTKGEGEGQRARNKIIQKMKHREVLKKQALENGESVDDWDKIVLVGKKIKQTSSSSGVKSED